jgi:NAD(P)-dependent dehydrogenase (short-subunit alcohol dehydrogenase family)
METFGGRIRFFGVGGAKLDSTVERFLYEAKFPYAIGYGLTETAPLLAGAIPEFVKWQSTGPAVHGVTLRIDNPNPETGEGEIVAKGPIKAMLDATVPFLAKSFSEFSKIRVNAVGAGPLKTSASAGIPDYIDNYIFAEELTLRKEALQTQEVANTVAFLLSPRSSGINASTMLVDAGMSSNYFDQNIVKGFAKQKT